MVSYSFGLKFSIFFSSKREVTHEGNIPRGRETGCRRHMVKSPFLETIKSGRQLFLDGAMGTMLQAGGMPPGSSPENFCMAHPDVVKNIHLAYLAAGSNIITSCTFGANPYKIPPDIDVAAFNRRMAETARQAIAESGRSDPVFVAGNVGPSGHFAKPLGSVEPEDLISSYVRQIEGLAAGGADLIFMETQFDLAEARAAVVAARRVCDLPVMASMTFEHGVSLTGSTPEIFAETMQNLGCDVIGTNCSLGPDEMLPVVRELVSVCQVPVMAEPNAGLPLLVGNKTVFPLGPERFAEKTARFASLGAQILGGCCGTTPEHIRMLVQTCLQNEFHTPVRQRRPGIVLTSRSNAVRIGKGQPLAVIGERINPTGKPKLTEELQAGEFGEALRFADEQINAGAAILDVNVGAPLVDEVGMLPALTSMLVSRQLAPLSLDSSNAAAIAAALPYCPGSCLVNSINGEAGRMETLGPLCRDYGAPFILLPLTGTALPILAEERIHILDKLLEKAHALGIPDRLVMADILALSVSSSPDAARECLKMAAYCAERGLASTIGLSNISFGLPARDLLNTAFLCMAHGAGLTSCIANPGAQRVAEARDAMSALLGHDRDSAQFIGKYAKWKHQGGSGPSVITTKAAVESLFDAVLAGDRENVLPILEKDLASGKKPLALVNDVLIPAITEVGVRYEKREYFLPQLIRSAETMQKAFDCLKPLLEETRGPEKRPAIVMATVEGDIHDIGKNIVCLLLGNHGFEVIDAGKDVPASEIVACAKKNGACLIGLSALMTTTMVRMEDTIKLLKKEDLPIRVLVGGAAVTRSFADSIGADAYCEDAVAGVAAAKKLLEA